MKKKSVLMVLLVLIGTVALSALEISPGWSYGVELGVARGHNAGSRENLAPMADGYLKLEMFNFLHLRTGVGYTPLHASKTYATNTFKGDTRVIFSPFHGKKYAPFLFAGAGASLDLAKGDSDVVPLFPFGLGMQIELKKGMRLELAGTYFHSNSDQLDRLTLYPQDTTEFTDGAWGLTVGLNFSNPGPAYKTQPNTGTVARTMELPAPVNTKTKDSDQDGLSDYDEINVYKTDPMNPDTDGDGLKDGAEALNYKTDPLNPDTDGDGLKDGAEVLTHKTNPLDKDTDKGTVNDGEEVAANKNPLDSKDDVDLPAPVDLKAKDSDQDGLSDYDETNVYKTDPLKADTDGDGLNDGAEVLTHKTDPLKADTDGDGLNDGAEVLTHRTDPLNPDTDGDGLKDGAEVLTHKTNPLDPDTDKGTVNDGEEVTANKDPLDPKDDVLDLRVGSAFSLEGILFESAKYTILPESIPKLEQAFVALKANPGVKILIVGHTDSDGSASSNLTLSKNRADAVKTWLVEKGIAADRIRTDGKGESQPRATNDTAEGKALNRRIEFVVE